MSDFVEQIKSWHYKAGEEDYFSKYVFEYLAFICYLQKVKFIDQSKDRGAIQKLKQDSSIKQQYLAIATSDLQCMASWEKIIEKLHITPLGNVSQSESAEEIKWRNCSHNKIDQKTENERVNLP